MLRTSKAYSRLLPGILPPLIISALFICEAYGWEKNSFSFLFLHDAYTQTFPWMDKVLESWRNFELPLWSWGTFLGTSLVGELQPGTLYPPTIILSALNLSTITTINILIYFHAAIAGIGVYLCNKILKGNCILAYTLSIAWAYYLLSSRAFGQANLYYGYCYISLISAALLCKANKFNKPIKGEGSPRFNFWNSLITSILISLSILAGHTYATIGCLFFWAIYFIIYVIITKSFNKSSIQKFILGQYFWVLLTSITTILLTFGQIFATSEYFKISRKWWGAGSTTYPHIVPTEVLKDASVSIHQLFSQLVVGKELANIASESSMMPNSNILFIAATLCFFIGKFLKARHASKSLKIQSTIEIHNILSVAESLFFASLIICLISFMPSIKVSNFLLGAKLYQILPLINSVRLPGRLIPIAELGLILTLISYSSLLVPAKINKSIKYLLNFLIGIFIIISINQGIIPSRTHLIKMGETGKISSNNPVQLLNSDCDRLFREIRKKSYGLIKLEESSNLPQFPKNMGDISGYPRFTSNIFRSSLTSSSLDVGRDNLANIFQTQNNRSPLRCVYNNAEYFFQKTNSSQFSEFSSFISDPEMKNNKNYIPQISINNHSIIFSEYYQLPNLDSLSISDFFIKTPYFPGWKAENTNGKIYDMTNNNNFLGYPDTLKNTKIKKIYYKPQWIYLIYLQLICWILIGLLFGAKILLNISK